MSEIIKVKNVYVNIYLFGTTNSMYITKVNLITGVKSSVLICEFY